MLLVEQDVDAALRVGEPRVRAGDRPNRHERPEPELLEDERVREAYLSVA